MDALDMESTKYSEDTQKLGIVHYESRLSVFNVTKADYDVYNCKATNELGVDESPVRLDGTSKESISLFLGFALLIFHNWFDFVLPATLFFDKDSPHLSWVFFYSSEWKYLNLI